MQPATFSIAFTEALTAYQAIFLAGRNLAPRTRKEYLTDLRQLCEHLTTAAVITTVQAVERRHLEGFLAALDSQHLTGSTRRRKVAAIRSFFLFLEDAGHRTGNPAAKLVPPEREWNQPRYLTEQEYKRLLAAVQHEVRDGAIIELFLQTGLRLSEVSRLQLADMELPARVSKEPGCVGSARVQGKGRRQRTVTLNWKACKALKAYLAVRPSDAEDDAVFQTKFRRGMGPRSIELLVEKYLKEAAIHDASVHTLRHTFATHSVKRGTGLQVIKEVLGHASLKTTTIYVGLAREEMHRQLQENAL
jgi:site-specific recombinase XerD